MKTPAAAGANFCYIASGSGILALPYLSGALNADGWSLLAFMMIFLGLASFSFHKNGDVRNWAHRADLTFIMVVVGALPFLAANGLHKAYAGKPFPAKRDPVALATKACVIAISGCVH